MTTDKPSNFVWWFRFSPHQFMKVLSLSNEDAGLRFKELLTNLLANDAPEGSVEAEMIENAKAYSQKQRDRINKRWNKDLDRTESSQPVVNPPPPQLRRPTRPLIPAHSNEIDLRDVYDFCDEQGIVPTIGKEWHDYMAFKGWPTLKNWQSALKGFANKKQKP